MYHMSGMRIFEVFPPSPSEHLITNLGCHISHSPKGPGYIGTHWIQTLNLKIAVVEIVGTIILQNIRIFFSFFKNYFDDNFLFIFFNMKYLSFFSFFQSTQMAKYPTMTKTSIANIGNIHVYAYILCPNFLGVNISRMAPELKYIFLQMKGILSAILKLDNQ